MVDKHPVGGCPLCGGPWSMQTDPERIEMGPEWLIRPATIIEDAKPSRIEDDEWWLRGLAKWRQNGTYIASK